MLAPIYFVSHSLQHLTPNKARLLKILDSALNMCRHLELKITLTNGSIFIEVRNLKYKKKNYQLELLIKLNEFCTIYRTNASITQLDKEGFFTDTDWRPDQWPHNIYCLEFLVYSKNINNEMNEGLLTKKI